MYLANKTNLGFASFLLILASCQSSHLSQKNAPRTPASDISPLLEKYYSDSVTYDFIKDKELTKQLKNSKNPIPGDLFESDDETKANEENQAEIAKNNVEVQNKIKKTLSKITEPTGWSTSFTNRWREHHDEFILHKLEPYEIIAGKIIKELPLSYATSRNMIVQLTNLLPPPEQNNQQENREQPYLNSSLFCDQPAILHGTLPKTKIKANSVKNFKWYYKGINAQKLHIQLKEPNTNCQLKFRPNEAENSKEYGINLVPENLENVGSPELKGQICLIPKLQPEIEIGGDPNNKTSLLESAFLFDQRNMTCPEKVDDYETLEDSKEAINAKIKLLIGQDLPASIYEKPDPYTKLDFSKAPHLDLILLSYLVFRADFSGHLIEQALRYHAARGTPIRIAVSDVISLGKDRQMLLDLQAEYSNVKLLFYRYNPQGLGVKDSLSGFHRTNHIKLFLTYSKDEPQFNQVILGGRNIHDGFVFDQPNSNYILPTVVTYGKGGDESFAHWEDFEVRFTSTDLVRTVMGQFFGTLHADYSTVHIRNYSENIDVDQEMNPHYFNLPDDQIIVRSLVSIPYKDSRNLEKYYVRLIETAQKTLKLSSPYLNLTQPIFDALVKAADRGIDIQIITRLDLKGDTADIILSDVNKKAVNKLFEKVKIFEYTTSGKILHSKLVIVDDKLVSMGSVNLNLRSFNHDLENSSLVYGRSFNQKITKLFERYKTETRPIVDKQKTTFWKKIIIDMIGTAL